MNCNLIWNEYELIYSVYESYNEQSLTLKGWSVTVGLAAIIAVYVEKLGATGRIVLWTAALSAVPFWILDAIWKGYQKSYLPRLKELEAIEQCSDSGSHSYNIVSKWQASHMAIDWIYYLPNTAFPHLFVIILGMYLVIFHPPKVQ